MARSVARIQGILASRFALIEKYHEWAAGKLAFAMLLRRMGLNVGTGAVPFDALNWRCQSPARTRERNRLVREEDSNPHGPLGPTDFRTIYGFRRLVR